MGRPWPDESMIGLPRSASDCSRAKRLRMACSVRPGSRSAILAHLLPSSCTERTMVSSYDRDHEMRSTFSFSSSSDVVCDEPLSTSLILDLPRDPPPSPPLPDDAERALRGCLAHGLAPSRA